MLRVFHLGSQSLWIDEVMTWWSGAIGHALPLSDLLENVHGPLYSLILHGWGALAGDSEWALRAPSMVFGVAMVPAMAWLAARWVGREAAVPAAWLTAGSPFLIWYSQEARNYTLLMLCVCVSAAALAGLRSRWTAGGVATFLGASALGLLSNFSFALLAPLYVWGWISAGGASGRRPLILLIGALALALVLIPWLPQVSRIWDWQRLHPGRAPVSGETALRGKTTFHPAAVPFALHSFAVGYTLGPSLRELRARPGAATLRPHLPALIAVVAVFGVLGVAGLGALARRGRLLDLGLWLVVPTLLVSYFAGQNFKVFHPRYLAATLPAFLLVVGAGLADLRGSRRFVAAGAVGVLWAWSLAQHYFVPAYGKDDYRGAVRYILAQARPGEQVLAVGAEDPVSYYYRGPLKVDRLWLGFAAQPDRLETKLDEKLAGAPGTWVVLSRPEDLDPGGVFARAMDARVLPAERFGTTGVRVWHAGPTGR